MIFNMQRLYRKDCFDINKCFGKGIYIIIIYSFGLLFQVHFLSRPLWALGSNSFGNQVVDSKALGMGSAFVATADNPSAIFFNPAGLIQLREPTISVGLAPIIYGAEYTTDAGVTEDAETQLLFVPNFYATWPLQDGKWVFGLGAFSPYGLSTHTFPLCSSITSLTLCRPMPFFPFPSPCSPLLKTLS